MGVVEGALTNTAVLYGLLRRWGINDTRFNTAMIFLIHYYKFKLIEDHNELLNYEFLNKCREELFYKHGVFELFDKFYKTLGDIIKRLGDRKGLTIIESITVEIIGKLQFFFFTHLFHLIDHPKFELTDEQTTMWLNSLSSVKRYIEKLKESIKKIIKINDSVLNASIHCDYVLNKTEQIEKTLLSNIQTRFVKYADSYLKKRSIEDFIVNAFFYFVIKQTEGKISINTDIKEKYNKLLIETLLHKFILFTAKHFDSSEKETIRLHISNFQTFLGEFQNGDLETQLMFLDHFFIFFTSSSTTKCMNSLSVLPYFLSLTLDKTDTMYIVNKKRYKKDGTKKSLTQMVKKDFSTRKNLKEVRQKKEKSRKKIFSIFNAVIFLGKLKARLHKKSRRRLRRYTIHYSQTEENVNPYIDYESFSLVSKIKVKFQLITKKTKNQRYKNHTIERM